jgi:hypothetical protein
MSLLNEIKRELSEAPVRHVRQHDGTLIFDIHQRGANDEYRGVQSLRFDAQTGYWMEHGQRVQQLSKKDVAFLSQVAPWTAHRYL